MTKRHYIQLAALIKVARQNNWTLDQFVLALVALLKEDNPRFNQATFMAACEP